MIRDDTSQGVQEEKAFYGEVTGEGVAFPWNEEKLKREEEQLRYGRRVSMGLIMADNE